MTFRNVVTLKWVFPDGISLEEARYRFISFILSLLIISVFTIGVVLYIGLGRVDAIEQTNQDIKDFQQRTLQNQKSTNYNIEQTAKSIANIQDNLSLFQNKATKKFFELDASDKATLRWRQEADSSDAIFQKMYLQQYNDYQLLLDAEKLKQSQEGKTSDGTHKKR